MANQLHSGHVKQEATQKRRTDEALERGLVQGAMTPNVAQLQRAAEDPARAQAADILALQRTAGNRAVSRLIQAKLTVGAAGDRYEQEADRVADQVLAMGAPAGRQRSGDGGQPGVQRQGEEEEVQTKPLAATITPLIQRQMDEEEVQTKPDLQRQMEEEEVQTKPDLQRRADGGFDTGPRVESRLSALKGGGSPLPAGVRSYMEPRFGADFSGVRLHTGSEAAQLNTSLRAQAFTHGQDIYLGSGASAPGSEAGNRLLAHELAHTIQQGSGTNRIARWGTPHGGTGHDVLTKEAFATLEPEIKRW